MAIRSANEWGATVTRWALIALGVSIPVSTALDNMLLPVILAACVISGQTRAIIDGVRRHPELCLPVSLFGLLAVGILYGESPLRHASAHLWKYADLMFIPVFALAFRRPDTRRHALTAFALTIGVTVVLSYMVYFGLLPKLPFLAYDGLSPTVFKYKITHNILVAFGAFLVVWLGRTSTSRRVRLAWFGLALLAALNVLLMVRGATGYVILFSLSLLWALERSSWRGAISGMLALVGLLTLLSLVPNPLQQRYAMVQQEIQLWRSGNATAEATSTGQRLEYYRNTLGIIKDHPLTGVGTGGFIKAYAEQVKGTGKQQTHNPHNEFLNITAQIGIAGLLVLIAMFWAQWRTARQLATPMEQSLARALVLTLVTGCLVNSLLLDHAEGLFYAWMSGLLYGGLKYTPSDKPLATA